jgi:hypothetical protein
MPPEVSYAKARRSGRIPRELPIQVSGIDVQGRDFAANGRTMLLSRYGGQILIKNELVPDQEISISLLGNRQDWDARVVCLCSKHKDGFAYGIEFLFQDGNFWGITFPGAVEPAPKESPAAHPAEGTGTRRSVSAPAAGKESKPPASYGLDDELEQLFKKARSKPGKHYALRLKCPHPDAHLDERDATQWLLLQNASDPLKKILETPWDFECPMHGAQREYPLEARENHGDVQFVFDGTAEQPRSRSVARSSNRTKHVPKAGSAKLRNRRENRATQVCRVWVRGVDLNGNPFRQSAYSIDISKSGACLEGVGLVMVPGTTIEVSRRWRKALFRVVWTGKRGTAQASQIGIQCLEPGKNLWGIPEPN